MSEAFHIPSCFGNNNESFHQEDNFKADCLTLKKFL